MVYEESKRTKISHVMSDQKLITLNEVQSLRLRGKSPWRHSSNLQFGRSFCVAQKNNVFT